MEVNGSDYSIRLFHVFTFTAKNIVERKMAQDVRGTSS